MIERKFVQDNILNANIEHYITERLDAANIVSTKIQKTALVSRITLEAERPGLIIGRKGDTIQKITKELEEKFHLESPQIEVVPLSEPPELNAKIMAKSIARQLARKTSWRRVLNLHADRIMRAGARGVELIISGPLFGKGSKATKQSILRGYVKKVGDTTKLVREGDALAKLKQGVIGIRVRIVPPNVVFPDKIDIKKYAPTTEKEEEPKEPTTEISKVKEEEKKENKEEKIETKKEKTKEKKKAKTTKKKATKKKENKAE